ncbi:MULTISPECIES: hypothetical protein [unclassified Streptomyces]|uniref:hypothetical protein n=1 Tax=unclassified Streptomyces TaxID=2593676 RepID=UPI00278BF38B|nr:MULTISPECIES: hypothetical protein [unclassified Streptomyces]
MLILFVKFALIEIIVGPLTHLPASTGALAGAGVALWLAVFLVRERILETGTAAPAAGGYVAHVGIRGADGMAAAAFLLGLVGLMVGNVLLGPTAAVLALAALRQDTSRQARAWMGLALGVAAVLLQVALVTTDGTIR